MTASGLRLVGSEGRPSASLRRMNFALHAARLVCWLATATLLSAGIARAGDRIHPAPEAVEPLAAGTRVPSAEVQTLAGGTVNLAEIVRDHGALLVFYRGGW